MDYTELALQFLRNMHRLRKTGPQKIISESMQGEFFVLKYLSMQEDYALPGEISNTMGISSARIAAALNSMEQKGLVTREIDKEDRRRILVRLTPEGTELAQEHHRHVVESAARMLSLLGEEDAREYIRITCRLAEICENKMDCG